MGVPEWVSRLDLSGEFIERLAAIEHERWADWQRYVHDHSPYMNLAAYDRTIPGHLVNRWQRQIATAYADLTEAEKQSDRDQVARYLPVLADILAAKREEWEENLPVGDKWFLAQQDVVFHMRDEAEQERDKLQIQLDATREALEFCAAEVEYDEEGLPGVTRFDEEARLAAAEKVIAYVRGTELHRLADVLQEYDESLRPLHGSVTSLDT